MAGTNSAAVTRYSPSQSINVRSWSSSLSCPAKAGHPVIADAAIQSTSAVTTGHPPSRMMTMRNLLPLEQFVELVLPLGLFLGRNQHGEHLLGVHLLDDAGRVRFHIGAGRDAAELCQERLTFLAQHEIRRQ